MFQIPLTPRINNGRKVRVICQLLCESGRPNTGRLNQHILLQERELEARLQHSEEMLQELTAARRENRLLQQRHRTAHGKSGEQALVHLQTYDTATPREFGIPEISDILTPSGKKIQGGGCFSYCEHPAHKFAVFCLELSRWMRHHGSYGSIIGKGLTPWAYMICNVETAGFLAVNKPACKF